MSAYRTQESVGLDSLSRVEAPMSEHKAKASPKFMAIKIQPDNEFDIPNTCLRRRPEC